MASWDSDDLRNPYINNHNPTSKASPQPDDVTWEVMGDLLRKYSGITEPLPLQMLVKICNELKNSREQINKLNDTVSRLTKEITKLQGQSAAK